ncbi:MAG: hypothetical protein NTY19_45505 [Planctomycetota bacterium]|nr:hypothetical protein [Planctomycetota bacterium]
MKRSDGKPRRSPARAVAAQVKKDTQAATDGDFVNQDFLAQASAVLVNLAAGRAGAG